MTVQTILRETSPEVPEPPHACLEGTVFVGYLVEEDGEEVEVVETIPCRRCSGEL